MTHTTTETMNLRGSAIGTTGAAASGEPVSLAIPAGKYLGTVTASVRTRDMAVPIRRGQAYIELIVVRSPRVEGDGQTGNSFNDVPVVWHSGAYVWTGKGATFHPNVFANENGESLRVAARIFHADNLDATRVIVGDVAVVFSSRPVAGDDDFDSEGWGERIVVSANPGAGAEPSITIPVGVEDDVYEVQFVLVTDGTAANRVPILKITRGSDTLIADAQQFSTASQTRTYTWALGVNALAISDTEHKTGWAGAVLRGGDVITVDIISIQGADDATAMLLKCRERVVLQTNAS